MKIYTVKKDSFIIQAFFEESGGGIYLNHLDLFDFQEGFKIDLLEDIKAPFFDTITDILLLLDKETSPEKEKTIRKKLAQKLYFKISPMLRNILEGLGDEISKGQVMSYKNLAIKLGLGKNYTRVVARAMSSNPFPLIYPCHRVIPFNSTLGKKFGVTGGLDMKKKLLLLEGIVFEKEKISQKIVAHS